MILSAVIPTRGDVDMTRIIEHLHCYPEIGEVLVKVGDMPYNRYLGAAGAAHDVIFTQDDDCITDLQPLLTMYEEVERWEDELLEACSTVSQVLRFASYRERGWGRYMVNAMTPEHAAQYPGRQTLIGFGAIFHRQSLSVFDTFERDALFYRESDRIFGSLVPHITVFPHIEILPHASAPNRLWKQANHVAARLAIEQRIREQTELAL